LMSEHDVSVGCNHVNAPTGRRNHRGN
jgi:hypothetical protein